MLYLMLTFCCKRGSTISQKQRISSYYDSQMALPGKLNIICCSNPPVFKSCCNFSSAQSIQLPNQSNFGSYSEFFLLFYHDLIQLFRMGCFNALGYCSGELGLLFFGTLAFAESFVKAQSSGLTKGAVDSGDGRNPANQLRLVVYPIIDTVLYMPGGISKNFRD